MSRPNQTFNLAPVRYENGRAMLMAGVRHHHSSGSAKTTIPAQWREFQSLGTLPGQKGKVTYGLMCGGNADGFEYMCGAEVEDFSSLPAGIGRMRIPVQHYAVFFHANSMSSLDATWSEIIKHWLPRSGYQSAHTPDFEVYGEKFDPLNGGSGIEIWLGIV